MLLQSWGGSIFLLPALPKAWPHGEVRGLRVRGAAGVDLKWNNGRLAHARLSSDQGGDYVLVYGKQTVETALQAGQAADFGLRGDRLVRL